MGTRPRLALLLDGAFVTGQLKTTNKSLPTAEQIESLCRDLIRHDALEQYDLYRIFFYDAEPYEGESERPISKEEVILSALHADAVKLRRTLELTPNFTIRRGETSFRGWTLKRTVIRKFARGLTPEITAESFSPDLIQKGVDMRIGLDIAALALKRLVQAVLLVTGDSDMAPAMRFARREGLRVYLHTMGFKGIRPILKAHADVVIQ